MQQSDYTNWSENLRLAEFANRTLMRRESRSFSNLTLMNRKELRNSPRKSDKIFFYTAFLLPFAKQYCIQKKKKVPVSEFIVRESLKQKIKDATDVSKILEYYESFYHVANSHSGFTILEIGSPVRQLKELWKIGISTACVYELSLSLPPDFDGSFANDTLNEDYESIIDNIVDKYDNLTEQVIGMGLENIWSEKPLINGSLIISKIGVPKGPLVSKIVDAQVKWQILNPDKSVEDCTIYLKKFWDEMDK